MYAPLRTFLLGLICSLLIASSDAAVNGSLGGGGFGASIADQQAPDARATLRQSLPTASGTEVLNGSSASGVKLADPRAVTYGGTASGGPRKEYGGSGRSIVTAQSVISSVNPSANQTPDPGLGGEAVNSPINTGHGSTQSHASQAWARGGQTVTKTCLWHSFSDVSGTKTRITLKFDWTLNASADAFVDDSDTSATAGYDFRIEYSLDNGSTWTVRGGADGSAGVPRGAGPDTDNVSINTSGSESVDLPNPWAIDITHIRVRDRIFASGSVLGAGNGVATGIATASVSHISLEVEIMVNCFDDVPANRWKGEYFNNTTLTGSPGPAMVRDDSTPGTDFFNIDFGVGSPRAACGLGVDNFSARWTRTVNFLTFGVYRFTATVDNGVRLNIDGQNIIDQWGNSPPNTYTADMSLSAAPHVIRLEFVEYTGAASANLSWALVPSLKCLPDVLIGSAPRTGGGDSVATTAISQATKPCGQKKSE